MQDGGVADLASEWYIGVCCTALLIYTAVSVGLYPEQIDWCLWWRTGAGGAKGRVGALDANREEGQARFGGGRRVAVP